MLGRRSLGLSGETGQHGATPLGPTDVAPPLGAAPSMTVKERVNILLVDDQPGKLLAYEAMLGELDENLIKASSGNEALEHLLRLDIPVVLMDVSMPDLDGFELAEIIRQHP